MADWVGKLEILDKVEEEESMGLFSTVRRKSLQLAVGATLSAALLFAASGASAAPLSRAPQDNLFFATSTEPLGLDPHLVDDNDSGNVNVNIYESLLRFKPGNTDVMPCLAESWTISDDGLVYTFNLRHNVKFHDGTPFNAEAVRANIERQSPQNAVPKMSYAPLVYGDVAKTEVVDDYTIKITLKQPSTPFLRNMAMAFAAPMVSPQALKQYNNDLMEHPVGTGPYKFVTWDRGQQIILTTNEDYWGEKPAIPNVIYRIIKETSARVVALTNQEVDAINGIDANVIPQLKQGNATIYEVGGNNTNYMLFNCRPGFITADRDVRHAIAQAVNVPELVSSLYMGYADYAKSYFPPFMNGFDPDLQPIAYDPDAAAKFFKEKGITKLNILTYSNARAYNPVGGQVLAEAVQGYLEKVGVKANIVVYDWTTFRGKIPQENWDVSFIGWIGDNGDPDNFINILASDDPISNQGLWLNDEFIALIDQALRVPDGKERIAMYQKASRILNEDVGVLPLSHAKSLAAYRANISGDFIHPIGLTFFDLAKKK